MTPKDIELYNKTKKAVYKKYPKHSAYRSGILVQKYKNNFTKKYGKNAKPYIGRRNNKKGLKRWFDEKWLNQRGEVGYKFKNDIYRPKIRITDDTPITHDELNDKEIKKARVKKYRKGRIDRFRKDTKEGGDIGVFQLPCDDYDDKIYINRDELPNEFNDESDSDDDLNRAFFANESVLSEEEEFNLFKEFYLDKVNICFNNKLEVIMNSNYTELLEEKNSLELILEDIPKYQELYFPFCDDLPNYNFNFNEELINNLDKNQKEELFNDVSQNLKQNILKIEIDTDVFIQECEFNDLERKIINEDLESIEKTDNFIRIICFILIKQIIENIIYNFLFPDRNNIFCDIDDAYEFDGGDWSKKYKKSINCNKPKGFSQKQYCKYGKNKTQKRKTKFKDYPEFRPNLTPREIFKLGSFGGTYWRPINSAITGKKYKNQHLKYPKTWWEGIPEDHLTRKWEDYDISINKYGVKVGTTLEFWEEKEWIKKYHPYGWVQWYCDFYNGKRSEDDKRQIQRWIRTAGPDSRFRRVLINLINKNNAKYDDFSISPKIRQTLQHWGYVLTEKDCK